MPAVNDFFEVFITQCIPGLTIGPDGFYIEITGNINEPV